MRKRYYLSFNMDDPRHREAEALVSRQGIRQRTDFVVSSILMANQAESVEQTVRRVIRDELRTLRLPQPPQPEQEVQLSDLPNSLINALEDL
ncbi:MULTISPECIES: plasmid segregation centromere-binding protein ParR [unclassified Dehalobacter]|uniref:plasmid segregation centromere-binding protein ParR n=2 Tax=Dehalobacter TaxID=56112 RepID=UPI000E6B9CD7|nr:MULTISPECIES: plasmid segregation centromere-binding protein ParR [unclassified Dehalobacter]RJE46643.1 plasmid segregation centromere-binding protein ParR [Dehalobacter sp. MCB1]TCX47409.1 plasmid segregation centromere-binding protein ParR [Dehalobacter sp. 14DCB1]TCX55622.1 plasmid segregation centromere-binding protein ParR [Dehalobacter sp. 12DCB1]